MRIQYLMVCATALSLVLASCNKHETSQPEDPVTSKDTNWVTQPQVDIPWPGLANSAWPMFMHDPQHTGRSPYRGPQLGQMEWMFDAGYIIYSSPAIGPDGKVYFAALQTGFFAVSPSGSQLWKSGDGWGESSPLIGNDGTIYVYGHGASPSGNMPLYAFDPSGNLKWKVFIHELQSWGGYSSPVISKDGGTIYIPEDTLYAIRKDGSFAWKCVPDTGEWLWYEPAFSPDGSTLYVPGQNGMYAIDTSGAPKWKFPINRHNDTFFLSSASVDNAGNLYFASQNVMYSLAADASVRWTLVISPNGPFTPPAIGRDGTIYFVGQSIYAIDYAGKVRWKYPLGVPGSASMPAIDIDGTLYFGKGTIRSRSDTINFLALNPNGILKFQLSLRSPNGTVPDIDSRPAISADGKIYVGCDYPYGHHLYKIK